ncbi:Pol polyprotein/retrotransposon [Ceratobasidium sp. AG-Ba]|nr:Pol polyprotein/retrotransposon [Ceratobasidium sp. AG-Ba]
MATTRSKRRALGAAAPDLAPLPSRPTSAAAGGRAYKPVRIEEIQDGSSGHEREGSADLEIPGSFAASPVNLGKAPDDVVAEYDSDEIDERIAASHISIDMGASTDDESCPPRASCQAQVSRRLSKIKETRI